MILMILFQNKIRCRDAVFGLGGSDICRELFGEECFMSPNTPMFAARDVLVVMMTHAWDRASKRWPGLQSRQEALEVEVNEAWHRLEIAPQSTSDQTKLHAFEALFKKTQKLCALLKEIGDVQSAAARQAKEDEVRVIIDNLKSKGKYDINKSCERSC